jgi:chaperone modulatory protein CbpM
MSMQRIEVSAGVILMDEHALMLDRFATACETDVTTIRLMVEEGLFQPQANHRGLRFSGEALARARRALRLQRDFETNLQSVAVMLDLLDEIERLRAQLGQLGKLRM